MHIISRKTLRQFWQRYPDSEAALIRWFKLMNSVEFNNFDELRSVFPIVERRLTILSLLICSAIAFLSRKLLVRQ
ncbi:MAG TPA: hypothetical protein DEG17_21455 [Cyanobacteria bacterium UBA11149]|nr:hypothetical protein [Cyanobacteria bacterium UBA11367]HBE60697.1 hypothetical protein [Cyanobacteria bacterium UBA11366]HBK66443.1 hypothetical protein [Cyanobacteria bacterium UBA11166]HBR74505.1 hypothetical protein [Cyanobacteria bacterium UBA11159]HBS68303.1 hypothetical protein [Cyanobacteria bacterium UBA11153]HBW91356.1 hypothetical protein [Cyanobacteria bacterium UBA11149]HCA93609.1 hypothetical protein [Cyanobacteria bacterium UBA9226]